MKKIILSLSMLFLTSVLFADPDPTVILSVEAFGTPYTQPFHVNATFSEPVTGFGKAEMNVVNALITSITHLPGSKSNYVITLTPKLPGPINIFIPSNVVKSLSTGSPNQASNKLNIMALDPILNPSSNFDLTPWNLTLPLPLNGIGDAITVSNDTLVGVPSLNTGYTNPPYFFTGSLTGSMSFFAPLNGATTPGSVFPRSELSEQLQIRGLPPTWTLNMFDSNTLTASLLITQVPSSKKVIIGKIQDKGTTDALNQIVAKKTLVKIYYDLNTLDPNGLPCNGCVYAKIRPIPAQDIYLKTVTLLKNTPLNKLFQYQIKLLRDGTLTVKINTASTTYTLNTSTDNTIGWGTQELYFKAGMYIQDNGSSNSQGGAASFYSLQIKHKGCPINAVL